MPGVGMIIGVSQAVAPGDVLIDVHLPVLVKFQRAFPAVLQIRIEEDIKGIDSFLPQDHVGAAADDNAGFLRKVQDDFPLSLEDGVIRTVVGIRAEKLVDEFSAAAHVLAFTADIVLRITAQFGRHPDKVDIVVLNSEFLRKAAGYRAPARSVFSADCNNHSLSTLPENRLPVFSLKSAAA